MEQREFFLKEDRDWLSYIVNAIAVDVLVTQGDRASAAMMLTL